jgi:hypothetical protein
MSVLDQAEIMQAIYEDGLSQHIAEMGPYDSLTLEIPVDDVRLQRIKKKDPEPMFVVVEVESGWSASKRLWKPERLLEAVEAVNRNKPVGNLGHPLLDPAKYDSDFPEPQVVWLGGAHTRKGDKLVAQFKGYVLPDAKARVLLENEAIDGVSMFGDSRMKPISGGYEVTSFSLETIDFARKGRSGMKSRIVALTGEQSTRGGNQVEAKDIAALSEDELRQHNPLLVREIERKSSETLETTIGEQTTTISALQPEVDILAEIKKLLKLSEGENVVEKVTNLLNQVEESARGEIKAFVQSLVEKKVKTPRGQAVVNRLIGEMHTSYDGELTPELKQQIETDFNSKIENDDDIKAVIGEMSSTEGGSEGEGGTSLGGRSRTGATRQSGDGGEGVVTKNENLVVRKTRVS